MDPLAWLFGLEHFGIKFDLENITTLVAALDHPERAFRSVHIAGTNGKGSVTAMVDAALRAAGHHGARYTSPHLVDVTERFVVGGRPVATAALADAVADVRNVVKRLQGNGSLPVHPTFFEVTTAVAFELFRRAGVEVAAVEVGMGGRLDATNVLQPVVTAITTVGLDHQRYLGGTLEEIAAEKAGIIKPGVPVVVGHLPAGAVQVVESVAKRRAAPIIRASDQPWRTRAAAMRLALQGAHQVDNAAVAIAVLEQLDAAGLRVPAAAIADGFAQVRWPGRLEWRQFGGGREALLDAAHNPDGAAALAIYLGEKQLRLPLVFGAMNDKDVSGILRALVPMVSSIVCTRASTRRAADPAALAEEARRLGPDLAVTVAASPAEALAQAWQRSPQVVVAGSIFLLGDVIQLADPGSRCA